MSRLKLSLGLVIFLVPILILLLSVPTWSQEPEPVLLEGTFLGTLELDAFLFFTELELKQEEEMMDADEEMDMEVDEEGNLEGRLRIFNIDDDEVARVSDIAGSIVGDFVTIAGDLDIFERFFGETNSGNVVETVPFLDTCVASADRTQLLCEFLGLMTLAGVEPEPPDVDEPDVDEPDADEMDAPDVDAPDVDEPDAPDVDEPDVDEMDAPDVDEPDVDDDAEEAFEEAAEMSHQGSGRSGERH